MPTANALDLCAEALEGSPLEKKILPFFLPLACHCIHFNLTVLHKKKKMAAPFFSLSFTLTWCTRTITETTQPKSAGSFNFHWPRHFWSHDALERKKMNFFYLTPFFLWEKERKNNATKRERCLLPDRKDETVGGLVVSSEMTKDCSRRSTIPRWKRRRVETLSRTGGKSRLCFMSRPREDDVFDSVTRLGSLYSIKIIFRSTRTLEYKKGEERKLSFLSGGYFVNICDAANSWEMANYLDCLLCSFYDHRRIISHTSIICKKKDVERKRNTFFDSVVKELKKRQIRKEGSAGLRRIPQLGDSKGARAWRWLAEAESVRIWHGHFVFVDSLTSALAFYLTVSHLDQNSIVDFPWHATTKVIGIGWQLAAEKPKSSHRCL